jgi:hypothetical protein
MLKGFAEPGYSRPSLETVKPSYAVETIVNRVIQVLRRYAFT